MASRKWSAAMAVLLAVGVGAPVAVITSEAAAAPGVKAPKQEKKEQNQKQEKQKDSKDKKESESPRGKAAMPKVGDTAPAWAGETTDGKAVKLEDYRGKIVLMDFWATWCPPCKAAMPGMQKLHEKYADKGVVILGMNTWERGDPAAYMKENKFTYPLILKGDDAAKAYGLSGIPAFFLVDGEGKILMTQSGFAPGHEKKIEQAIERALAAKGPGSDDKKPAGGKS